MQGFVYLIFSHGNASQLVRLAKVIRILSPESAIVFHHDASSLPLNRTDFNQISNVHFVPNPIKVRWGDISFVDALVLSSKWALDNLDTEWLITLSGMDYPIQPLAEFEGRLSCSGFDAAFSHFEAFSHPYWPVGEADKRYCYSYYELPKFPYYYRLPGSVKSLYSNFMAAFNNFQSWIKFRFRYRNLPTALGFRNRLTPFDDRFICYGGADWFNLNKRCVYEIQDFLIKNKSFRAYYKRTLLPSESMVHTILANNPNFKINNEAYRFTKWDGNFASPSLLGNEDFDQITRSGYPFARKFDINFDENIFDMLDTWTGV
jgi:hypothetical protein